MNTSAKPTVRATSSRVLGTYKICAWCGEPISGVYFERHHWLIKRSHVPKSRFNAINVLINVVPLHHICHQQYGQTKEMYLRCLGLVSTVFGKDAIWRWKDKIYDKDDQCDAEE